MNCTDLGVTLASMQLWGCEHLPLQQRPQVQARLSVKQQQ
jgi:hypothetical protein